MSKQKRGMFRGMIAAIGAFFSGLNPWRARGKYYADPLLRDPYTRSRKGSRQPGKAKAKRVLPCDPGDIRYHDKLVKHFGRRRADGYSQCIQRKFLNLLPTEQDFADNPPWAFLQARK